MLQYECIMSMKRIKRFPAGFLMYDMLSLAFTFWGHFLKVHYSSQFQWPHWEWLKSNFERSSSRSSFRRTFQNKIGLFWGFERPRQKNFQLKERRSSSFFFIFRIHFYAGIVMVEYKEICGSTSTICKVVKKEKEVMKKKERDMTTNCKIISFCSVGPTLQSLGTFFFGYTT